MNYSIIVPLYNESNNIINLHDEIMAITDTLKENRNFELIYIDDGSSDDTFDIIKKFENKKINLKILRNKKNLSQSISISNGLENSEYENIIMLDGDGQNDPKDLINMIEKYEEGYDLVHGYRKKRKDNFILKTLPSLVANFFVRLISSSKIIDHGCSLKIINKKFLYHENLWGDFHRLLAARLAKEKIKVFQVETNHRERKHGKSNYGLSRVFKVLVDLIYMYLFNKNYNKFYIIGYLGFFSLLTGLLSFIYMMKLKFINEISFISTPLPLVTSIFLLSSLIFFSFMFIIQLILNIRKELRHNEKDYDIFKN